MKQYKKLLKRNDRKYSHFSKSDITTLRLHLSAYYVYYVKCNVTLREMFESLPPFTGIVALIFMIKHNSYLP